MPGSGKVKSIEELAEIAAAHRAAKKSIVHCHGVFELLHAGAIQLLERSKQLGDTLVVTIEPDPSEKNGHSQTLFCQEMRAEAVAALSMVDWVAINKWPQSVEAIQLLRPDVFVPRDDDRRTDAERARLRTLEETIVKATGGRIATFAQTTVEPIPLPQQGASPFSPETAEFLASFASRYALPTVAAYLESIRPVKVLLIGETIIDEYQYCETIGKSGKEPILAMRYASHEKFAGGVLATANHAAGFVDQAGVLTFLGTQDSHEEFIRETLDAKIDAMFLYLPGAPTTIKRRFVELYPFQKLFEVYVMNDEIGDAPSQAFSSRLKAALPRYDAVIANDYGHGVFSPEIVDFLCSQDKFLAVNTQTNAANQGFNTVSKYRRADYICLSEKELRLEARSRTKDIRLIAVEVAEKLSCPRMLITRGQRGCLCYQKGEGFVNVPPFTQRIVDRVGAGDALLAVTSLCVAQGVPMEVVGFIGNSVGALAVQTVGHRDIVTRAALCRQIESLMHCQPGDRTP